MLLHNCEAIHLKPSALKNASWAWSFLQEFYWFELLFFFRLQLLGVSAETYNAAIDRKSYKLGCTILFSMIDNFFTHTKGSALIILKWRSNMCLT